MLNAELTISENQKPTTQTFVPTLCLSVLSFFSDVQYGRVSNFKLRKNKSDTNLNDAINSIKLPQQERETDFEGTAGGVIYACSQAMKTIDFKRK